MRRLLISLIVLSLVACRNNKHEDHVNADVYYTCSMDPQVIESKPGKCPICKMPLTPVNKSNSENDDELQLSDQQIQLGNIQVDAIRSGLINDRMVLTATLATDQSRITSLSTRTMGRIDKLYFKNEGDFVKRGDPVFDLYSEDLNNAKQEYRMLLQKRKALDNSIVDFDQLIKSAKIKLELWGMTESQIKLLESNESFSPLTTFYSSASGYITLLNVLEGQYVMEGGTVLRLADLSSLWAEAQVYTSQLALVDPKSSVQVQLVDFPEKILTGKIEFINPEINPGTRITLIRVSIPNADHQLKPGMVAHLSLSGNQHSSLTLPVDAVIQDAKGSTVWVQTGKNRFKSRMVEVGLDNNGFIEVLSGIEPGDKVVISGAYLLNSEYIFKKGTNPMAGHDMKNM